MNFLDAAYEILQKSKLPLHYADITRQALHLKLITTKGQTPEATMGARLYVDTKRAESRFRRAGRNVFGLAQEQAPEIAQQVQSVNKKIREELHDRLLTMPPDRFEVLIEELLLAIGFDEESLKRTPYSNDGGIDVRGVLNAGNITQINAAVQVKRWKKNIHAPIVQALRGSLIVHEQGIIITTGKFSKGAREEAEASGKVRISLVDCEKLLDLLIEHSIGVKTKEYKLHQIDEDWWMGIVNASDEANPVPVVLSEVLSDSVPLPIYPLTVQAQAKGQTFFAELLTPIGTIRHDGIEYTSPSKLGQVLTGWRSCNGWQFWKYEDLSTGIWKTIDELRIETAQRKIR